MKVCAVKECRRGPVSRGLCGSHYPMVWTLVKLGFVSEGSLIDAGFLKPSKCLQKTKKLELESTTGFKLVGTVEVTNEIETTNGADAAPGL